MSAVQRDAGLPESIRLGGVLFGLAVVAVVVAYPPPASGFGPLLGIGSPFLPLLLSVLALLIALLGGVSLARGVAETRTERAQRLLVRAVVPVAAVAVLGAYLVVVAGFGPLSSFIVGAVLLAVVAGVADEFVE